MNFNEFVKEVNASLPFPPQGEFTTKILNTAFEIIKVKVAEGEKVEIRNFGIFKILNKPERKGRNPKTGDSIIIPAKKVPKFKPSSTFKKMVDK